MALLLDTFLGLKAPNAFLAILFKELMTVRCRLAGGLHAPWPVAAPEAAAAAVTAAVPVAPTPAFEGGTC